MITVSLSGCPDPGTEVETETDTTSETDSTDTTTSPPSSTSSGSTTTGSTSNVDTTAGTTAESTSDSTTGGSTTGDSTTGDSTTSDSTTGVPSECGNGVVEDGEECDEPDLVDGDGCDVDCTLSVVVELAAGGEHTCVRLDSGLVRCWGDSALGQLGQADTTTIGDDELPSSIGTVMVGAAASQIVSGYRHTCVIAGDGVRCWGSAQYAQLGLGAIDDIGDDETPSTQPPVDLGETAIQLASGFFHTCALLDTGAVRCWGAGSEGQLGYGNNLSIGDDEAPASAGDVSLGGTAVQVATGFLHSCALLENGDVRCWGQSSDGQLGLGYFAFIGDDELPTAVPPVSLGGPAQQIVAGGFHTCALMVDGTVRCWGRNAQGQLGLGNTSYVGDDELPSAVGPVDVGGTVVQLEAGFGHTCARLDTGEVRCWGFAALGELGSGSTQNIGDDELPSSVAVVDVGGPVTQLSTATDHTCALLDSGAVRCWGFGEFGQLGYGALANIGDDEPPSAAGDVEVF